jgi:hypothetical protein
VRLKKISANTRTAFVVTISPRRALLQFFHPTPIHSPRSGVSDTRTILVRIVTALHLTLLFNMLPFEKLARFVTGSSCETNRRSIGIRVGIGLFVHTLFLLSPWFLQAQVQAMLEQPMFSQGTFYRSLRLFFLSILV